MVNTIAKVRKAIVAAVGVAVVVFGPDTAWVQEVVAILTALGVYTVPNR